MCQSLAEGGQRCAASGWGPMGNARQKQLRNSRKAAALREVDPGRAKHYDELAAKAEKELEQLTEAHMAELRDVTPDPEPAQDEASPVVVENKPEPAFQLPEGLEPFDKTASDRDRKRWAVAAELAIEHSLSHYQNQISEDVASRDDRPHANREPKDIDAELWGVLAQQSRSASRIISSYVSAMRNGYDVKIDDELASFKEAAYVATALEDEYSRRPWTRAWYVNNLGGHLHSSSSCHTLRATTRISLISDLSGKSEEEIVAAAGDTACTNCYPTAPVVTTGRARTFTTNEEKEEVAAKAAAEETRARREEREKYLKDLLSARLGKGYEAEAFGRPLRTYGQVMSAMRGLSNTYRFDWKPSFPVENPDYQDVFVHGFWEKVLQDSYRVGMTDDEILKVMADRGGLLPEDQLSMGKKQIQRNIDAGNQVVALWETVFRNARDKGRPVDELEKAFIEELNR